MATSYPPILSGDQDLGCVNDTRRKTRAVNCFDGVGKLSHVAPEQALRYRHAQWTFTRIVREHCFRIEVLVDERMRVRMEVVAEYECYMMRQSA